MTLRNRSTRPPSISTHVNRGAETRAWQSFRSLKVCSPPVILRAKRITPAGCTCVSREARPFDISVPSNPMMSNWPTLRARSSDLEVGIVNNGSIFIKPANKISASKYRQANGQRRTTNDQRPEYGSAIVHHCYSPICFFNSASKFNASIGVR